MKVTDLRMTNFRSYKDETKISFNRLTIVRGPNGAGKSAIRMAIEYAFTGRCDVTDRGGRGAEDLTRLGAAGFAVEVDVELSDGKVATITRTRNSAGGSIVVCAADLVDGKLTNKFNYAGKQAEFWIQQNIAPIEVLSAVLNCDRFLEMTPNDQKALLASSLRPEPVTIDENIRAILKEAKLPDVVTIGSAVSIDAWHKVTFELRTRFNREVKEMGELQPPNIPRDCPTVEVVREQIAALHKTRDGLVQQRATLLAGYESEVRDIERGRAMRAAAFQQKEQNEKLALNGPALDAAVKEAKGAKKASELDAAIAVLEQEINQDRAMLAKVNDGPSNCPTCNRPMPEDETVIDVDGIQARIEKSQESLEAKRLARVKLGDPAAAQARVETHQRAMPLWVAAENTLKELGDPGSGLPVKPDTSAIDAEIETVDERIANGNVVADRVGQLRGDLRRYEESQTAKAAKQAIANKLDTAVEYFSDRGTLKAKLIGGKLPAFRNRINEVLSAFGYHCWFDLEPFEMLVRDSLHCELDEAGRITNGLKPIQLSESQRYRFGVAFQVAIAEATGVRLVIVDRADMLQADARSMLSQELLNSDLEQAIVLATSDGRPLPSRIPTDVRFIELAWMESTSILVDTGASEDIYAAQ